MIYFSWMPSLVIILKWTESPTWISLSAAEMNASWMHRSASSRVMRGTGPVWNELFFFSTWNEQDGQKEYSSKALSLSQKSLKYLIVHKWLDQGHSWASSSVNQFLHKSNGIVTIDDTAAVVIKTPLCSNKQVEINGRCSVSIWKQIFTNFWNAVSTNLPSKQTI